MLDWLTIVILLTVGIGLIVTELIFIPGTTLFGIAGLVLSVIGIVLSFVNYGFGTGMFVLALAFILMLGTLFYSMRSGTWDKVSLKSAHNSRVNDDVKHNIWKGDTGKTISSLRPGGKAIFNEVIVEVSTRGNYVSAGIAVRVIEVKDHKIIVEPVV